MALTMWNWQPLNG